MKRLKSRLSNRPGITIILSMLMMVIFVGAAAFAVDASHAQLRRADVHAASDAAALAGIEKYAESGDEGLALTEAQSFAGKFKADTSALTVLAADFSIGHWDSTAATFTAGGVPKNAAQAIVRYNGTFMFGPLLGVNSHTSTGTSVAVGVASRTVSKSSCVAPVVLSFADLLSQLGLPSNTDTLSAANIQSLLSANAGNAVTLGIPNGSQVKSLNSGLFYQVELPPVLDSAGVTHNGQNPSASDFKNAFTCAGGNPTVGVGDWLAVLNGQDANQAKQGMDNVSGGQYPATIEVALTDQFSNTVTPVCASSGSVKGCLHVGYLGAFTVTAQPGGKGVTGYFTALEPNPAGVVAADSTDSITRGPLAAITTIRLVY